MARPKRTYIKLAAFFASLPPGTDRVEMTLRDTEEILGESLPPHAHYPFWWANDRSKVHARAWLASHWEVVGFDKRQRRVSFRRCGSWSLNQSDLVEGDPS
jgi:hypothetical protein